VANAIYAFGKHDGIGYSPFGIDRSAGGDTEFARGYDFIAQIAPLILENQGKGTMTAVLLERDRQAENRPAGELHDRGALFGPLVRSGQCNATPDCVAGPVIATGPDDFIIVGRGMNVYFASATNPSENVGLGTVDEGVYTDGPLGARPPV